MARPTFSLQAAILHTFLLVLILSHSSLSIISKQSNRLSREEYLRLDFEVSEFYETREFDKNVTFNEHLFKSIRAFRHTIVMDIRDYKYSNMEIMKNSMGKKVHLEKCKDQLKTLVELTRKIMTKERIPLSAQDFIGSNGQTGSGILNGNFVWPGSYSSCIHAKIKQSDFNQSVEASSQDDVEIKGRYCVGHLKAKSWPKEDIYFGDRMTLRKGLCLPESCHSYLYETDKEIQQEVDFLNRFNLLAPFNGTEYETIHLYCLPDEDSPHRQMDLGAKLFVAFCCLWAVITLYTNYRYNQRAEAMKRLHDAVDIRMVISERRRSSEEEDDDPNGDNLSSGGELEHASESKTESDVNKDDNQLRINPKTSNLTLPSASASHNVTPLASDVEDDFNMLTPLLKMKSNCSQETESKVTKRQVKQVDCKKTSPKQSPIDFFTAFSIQANLRFLFSPRSNFVNRKPATLHRDVDTPSSSESKQTRINYTTNNKSTQHTSPVNRRTTSSNEALIKDLSGVARRIDVIGDQEAPDATASDKHSSQQDDELEGSLPLKTRKRRINIEIFDGVKVIATCYIIFGHTLMFFFGAVTDLRFADERMFDFTMSFSINTLQVVGLFYIITGCLLTYFAFSKAKLKQLLSPMFWLFILFARYCRLLPTYLLVFWFARHVAPLVGSGPDYLEYRTDEEHVRGYCAQESWFTMLTMSAADVKIPLDCVPQTWYLSNDFRTLAVLPVYVFILAKNAKLGYAAILATFAVSTYKMNEFLKLANIDYKILLKWQPHVYAIMADRLHDVYTNFYVRMSTYLLGVIVGHLLYLYEIQRIKQWPSWFRRWGMKVALTIGTLFFFGANLLSNPYVNQFLPRNDQVDSDKVVLLIPLFKISMELCICVVSILLVTGGGFQWFQDLLSSQTMKVLSNISYAVFLTHIELMYKMPAFYVESDYSYLIAMAVFFTVSSHVVSFFIHLLYEMPINNVMRSVFKRTLAAIS